MKTKSFWLLMAVAAILTCMTFTSCGGGDDDPYTPDPPGPGSTTDNTIVDTRILESKRNNYAVVSSNDEQTLLEAKTWVKAELVKANEDNNETKEYSATLKMPLKTVTGDFTVKNMSINSDPVITFSYVKQGEGRKEGSNVTVADSALVMKVSYPDNFNFNVSIPFEVATFSNEKKTEVMKHYRPKESDAVFRFVELGNISKDGEFDYRDYKAYVQLRIDNESYYLNIKLNLSKKSEVVVKTVELLSYDYDVTISDDFYTKYDIVYTLKETLNGVSTNVSDRISGLECRISDPPLGTLTAPNISFVRNSSSFSEKSNTFVRNVNEYISVNNVVSVYKTVYNHFTLTSELTHNAVNYNDGSNVFSIPALSYKENNVADSFSISHVEGNKYLFDYVITANLKDGVNQSLSRSSYLMVE